MRVHLISAVAAAIGSAAMGVPTFVPGGEHQAPIVDLGYAVHSAHHNENGDYYAFNNIRYANAPVGEARFQPPAPVSYANRNVNDGSLGFKCPQAYPEWALKSVSEEAGLSPEEMLQVVLNDPTASEDCLFLDVLVPVNVFKQVQADANRAPVIVWLYGGGYVFGHKNDAMYEASGLMARARADHGDGVIFVGINYRLGLFGWLNGNGDEHVFPNVGLQDQLFALHWIQKYISHFGGDAENVTVMGQSAGAGSITHHLTAVSDDGVVPFHRAIIQSPGWEHGDSVKIWQTTLSTASVLTGHPQTSGKNLVDMDFATLNQINGQVVFGSNNGSFTFGPTPDGGYVPDFAESLLLQGHFDSRPKLMIGHNSNEAGLFIPAELDTEEELVSRLTNFLEELHPEAVKYVLNELYPCPSDATSYSTQSERAMLIVSESSFACNTRYLAVAFGNSTMSYRFQMPPGIHGQDLPYTFFHENTTETEVPIPGLAKAMQAYFTRFAKSGNVNLADEIHNLLDWPEYGDTANIVTFGLDGIGIAEDDTRNHRCDFWQKGNTWKN